MSTVPGSGAGGEERSVRYGRWPAWCWFLALSSVWIVGCYLIPSGLGRAAMYGLLGVASAVVTVVGVRRYRPAAAWPWYVLAVGRVAWAAGDVLYWWYTVTLDRDVFPSLADVFYLGHYALLVIGLVGLVRARRPGKDRPGLLDALVLSTGAAMLAWVFLIVPNLGDSDLSLPGQVVSLAYPAGDILVLGVLLRLTTGRGDRPPAYRLIVSSMIAMLIGNIVYALLEINEAYQAGSPLDVTWLAMYALGGAASLHPSMSDISRPARAEPEGNVHLRRLVALAMASLMAPTVLAIEWLRGMKIDYAVIIAGSAVLFLLVITRLHGLVALLSETLRSVEEQATHDQLTGLANRRLFHTRWQQSLDEAGGPTALLYVDLDGFKPVNDTLGHEAGDSVLVEVAERLRRLVRAGDVVARLGGDEFAVILPWTDATTADAIAKRLVAAMAEPFDLGDRPVSIGASVGGVTAAPNADPEAELRRADTAMYAAKAAGRGRVEFASAPAG
jgi:diguanylate cyclase (GGDEF)-like protein